MSLEEKSLNDLEIRRGLLTEIIREANEKGDPRVAEPQRQLRNVVAEINKRKGLPPPEDQVVGLDTLKLFAEAVRPGGKGR